MKKITLFVALLCSISVFSTRYLVKITGSSIGSWRAAGAGEVLKTYSDFSSFIWGLTENSSSNTVAGDEIWMLAGTYNVNAGYFSWKTSVNFYGGFAGNENATTDRSKVFGGKAWEFSNPTIWDGGNNTANFGLKTTDAAGTTYFDGLTLQNFKQNGTGNVSGVGAYLGISAIMQNCIVKNNSFVGTTANTGSGAGVYMKGAKLIDSYIYNNSCLIGTGTGAAKGGGVAFSTSVGSKIQGCTIEGNSATNSSGGIFLTQWNNGEVTVDNCILKNNSTLAATSGGGAIGGGLFNGSNAANKFNITNSQFINNTYTGGDGGAGLYVYAGGFAVTITGCTFTGNTSNSATGTDKGGAGIYIQASNNTAASPCIIDKCIFTGNTVTTNARGAAILTKSPTKITNCIIANNSCAVTNNSIVSLESSDCQTLNCTFAKNLTSGTGGAIDYESRTNTTSAMTNSIFWGNSYNAVGTTNITFSYNAFDGTGWGTNTVTTLTATNTFVSPTSFQGIPVGQTQIDALAAADWSLKSGCPAINAATNLSGSGVTTDIAGNARPTVTPSKVDMGAYEYISYQSNASGNWGDYGTWQLSADGSTFSSLVSAAYVPTSSMAGSVSILNGHTVTVAANATSRALTINSGGKLTLNSGNTLGVNGNLNINSDGTNGTGTFVDYNSAGGLTVNNNGTTTVQQYLSTSRNWYMSTPVSGGASLPIVDSGTLIFYSYPESDSNQAAGANGYAAGAVWNTVSSGTFATGTGYIVKPSATTSTVTFSGTGLNTGNKTISGLTYSSANPKHGFNLIANPYPSYLNVLTSITANSNLESTVWYKTRDNASTPHYFNETVNATSGVGTNASGTGRVTGYIPPMQAFWVRTKTNNQSIALTNANRSHFTSIDLSSQGLGSVPTTLLKAPSEKNQNYMLLGLNVSNGTAGDETIVMFTPEASNGLDAFDSGKMSNSNASMPELFTVVEGSQLAINSMNSLPNDIEIPLGFTTGTAGIFTINASMINNFPEGTQILLKDNIDPQNPVVTDLTTKSCSFNSPITTAIDNTSRFTITFKAPSVATGINTDSNTNVWISTRNGQIVVNGNTSSGAMLEVFNAVGQKVISRNLSTTNMLLNNNLSAGAYLVKLTNEGKSITRKIIID